MMQIGLSVSGTVFSMGIHARSGRSRITPEQLMDQALNMGLEGVEFSTRMLQSQDNMAVADYAREHGLYIVLETTGFEPAQLSKEIELTASMGVKTLRTLVGGAKIGGDRRPLTGRWQAFMQSVLDGLRRATEVAEKVGVNIAVENHQDLASEELLWLCESIGSANFGINLDTGNPLATAEEPLDFARRVVPYLKNVHLKDYWIYLSEEGYRLVRCPLGQGVIDFEALYTLFAENCPDVTMSIELGALEARHIRVMADDFWPEYPPRTAAQLAHVLRFIQANAKPVGDWQTPFEKNEPVEVIAAYEERQLVSSLAYIQTLKLARKQHEQ